MMTKSAPSSCSMPKFNTAFSGGKCNSGPALLRLRLNVALYLRSVKVLTIAFEWQRKNLQTQVRYVRLCIAEQG